MNWNQEMVVGYGDIIKETLQLTGFEGITSSIAADIKIKQSDEFKVEVAGQKNIIDLLDITVEDNCLEINFKNGYNLSYNGLKIFVEAPKFTFIKMLGSGSLISTDDLSVVGLDIIVSGSADVDINYLKCNNLTTKITGSGDVKLKGLCGNANFIINGSGDIFAKSLVCENSDCSISGSGDICVFVNESFNVKISGSGSVYYYSSPIVINKKISGSGSLIQT